jgi:hypothetical protein
MSLAPTITPDGAGGYRYDQTFSEAETVEFVLVFTKTDDTAFPWADYTFEYAVSGTGISLTSAPFAGIAVDTLSATVLFVVADPFDLSPDTYAHECRMVAVVGGHKKSIFSGYLTIADTPFRA